MSETELKKHHPYRSMQLRGESGGERIDERVMHVITALGALAFCVVASAIGLVPIAFLLIFGACVVWIFWAVPYAIYLVCRGRWNWRSTRCHLTASLVWMLAIGMAVCASAGVDGRLDGEAHRAQRALDELVRTTAQAVRRYRADHGQYPETLNELVPIYLPRVPVAAQVSQSTCPIEYGVWQGVPTLWIPGRDPMFDTCIHRRGFGFDLRTGRRLPR